MYSGIHATIAGVLLASAIPHRIKDKDFSLLVKIEHAISPYVAFMIMPLFAFANAGVNLEGLSLSSLLAPVPLEAPVLVSLIMISLLNSLQRLQTQKVALS